MEGLVAVLAKFHREIVVRDIERIVGASEQRLRDEIHGHFDALSQRLARLEDEYQMVVAGLKRVEERLDRLEQRMDRLALRAEVQDLKGRVESLERKIAELESEL